jgi:hypothetical protein
LILHALLRLLNKTNISTKRIIVQGVKKIINHLPIWKESGVGVIKGHPLQGEVNRVMQKRRYKERRRMQLDHETEHGGEEGQEGAKKKEGMEAETRTVQKLKLAPIKSSSKLQGCIPVASPCSRVRLSSLTATSRDR